MGCWGRPKRGPRTGRGAAPPRPPAGGDAAALPFGGPAPDAVVDAVAQGVLQARFLDGTIGTDAAGDLNAHTVTREECLGRDFPAFSPLHPFRVHDTSVGRT